jgi:hypothetical protein
MERLEAIRKIVEQSPNDPFPRYGLAMELSRSGHQDEAHQAFVELERRFPEYVPQYLMHAKLLGELHLGDQQRGVLGRGIAAARASGDGHALDELGQALAALEAGD